MNRALQALAVSGLLERRARLEPCAIDPLRKAILEIPITRIEVEGGYAYKFDILEQQKDRLPSIIKEKIGLSGAVEALHLRGLHLADGSRFYEDRWVNLAPCRNLRVLISLPLARTNGWCITSRSPEGTSVFSRRMHRQPKRMLWERARAQLCLLLSARPGMWIR